MTENDYAYIKSIVLSFNHLKSSPYPVSLKPFRDDEGLHAKLSVPFCNVSASRFFNDFHFLFGGRLTIEGNCKNYYIP